MRREIGIMLVAASLMTVTAHGTLAGDKGITPHGTLTRPENSYDHPDLEKAWLAYDAAIDKATQGLRDAIGEKRKAAREQGNLDSAKQYKSMLDALETTGELPTDDKALKKQLAAAQNAYKVAANELEATYTELRVKLTKDTTLDESAAEDVETERKELFSDNNQRNIPANAIKIGSHKYAIFWEPLTQAQAVIDCKQRGGYLATITTPAEFDAFKRLLVPKQSQLFLWVDGTDRKVPGRWTLLNGEPLTFLPWLHPQPDSRGQDHGLSFFLQNQRGQWLFGMNDYPDDQPIGYVCEWD